MKRKSNAAATLIIILLYIAACVFSWGVTCGIVKLITMCFGWTFSFEFGTGIWLVFVLLNWTMPKNKKE